MTACTNDMHFLFLQIERHFSINKIHHMHIILTSSRPLDLMTEMMDLSSDVGGPGIPFLDYRTYAERVFFPGQKGAPLSQNLDLPDSRRQTVEQGLGQLNNLLNNRLFLTRVSEEPCVHCQFSTSFL